VREVSVPQSYAWGAEAQIDWYEAYGDLADERTKLQVLVVRELPIERTAEFFTLGQFPQPLGNASDDLFEKIEPGSSPIQKSDPPY
jgi:hypothetical protein